MKVVVPFEMTDARLDASTVAENDHAEWDSATTYGTGARVIKAAAHKVYESISGGNLNNNPETTLGTFWTEISATNRWKPFDSKIADQSTVTDAIMRWDIVPGGYINSISLFNVSASEVRLRIYEGAINSTVVYDKTVNLVDTSAIVDPYTLATTELDDTILDLVLNDFTISPGQSFRINVGTGVGPSSIGQIVFGKEVSLGETLEGTTISFRSFSTKEQDAFGSFNIVERGYSFPAEFLVAAQPGDSGRIKRFMASVNSIPIVAYASAALVDVGVLVYGFVDDMDIEPKLQGIQPIRVKIEALT